jgi:hypothetical protein
MQQTPYAYWLRKDGTIATARASPLTGKTPQELVLMAETRRLLQLILHSHREETSPELAATIDSLLRARLRRTSPFMELSEIQRIAWLDEITHVECSTNLGAGFIAGDHYRVACMDIPTNQIIDRQRMDGGTEEVLITGNELIVTIRDQGKRIHAFTHIDLPITLKVHERHEMQALLDHFVIPPAPDITKVFPATYNKYKAALAAL